MRKILVLLTLVLGAIPCIAQQYPPYIFLDANLNPYPSGSGAALGSNPPYALCYTNVTGQPLPCNFGGSGPSFAYPLGTGFTVVTGGAAWGTTLADPLATGHGGTGTASTLTGLVRGGSPMTAAELSGDATTSGSNAVTVVGLNGTNLSGLATGLLKNTTATGVPSIVATNGAGAGIPTGPTSSTSGDVATFTGTAGQIADGGTLLSALLTSATAASTYAPLASPSLTGTTTFGPTSNYYWQIASDASFPIIKMLSPSPTNTLLADIATTSSGQVFVDYAGGSGGSFNIRTRTSSSGRVTALTIDSSGNATFAAGLTLSGIVNAATGDYLCYNAGVIEFNTATCTLSLRKYKQNIHALSTSLTEVMALKPVEYRYRPEMKLGDKMQIGFIADDVAKLDPRIAVYKNNGELESVDYEHMTALLTSAIQEQQKEIATLKDKIRKLEKRPQIVLGDKVKPGMGAF